MYVRHLPGRIATTAALGAILLSACAGDRSAGRPPEGAEAADRPAAEAVAGDVAGSYRLLVCRGSCADTARVLARGHLVLMPGTDSLSAGCFSLGRAGDRSDTFAGIRPTGDFAWSAGSVDPLRLDLYRSPDARYGAELRPAPGGLRGTGRSAGIGYEERAAPADSVVAERIGPPDAGLCAPPEDARPPQALL